VDEPAFLSEAKTQAKDFVSQQHTSIARRVDEPAFLSEAKTQAVGFVSQDPDQPDESSPEKGFESLEKELPASQAA
jgi:hypothetical protein